MISPGDEVPDLELTTTQGMVRLRDLVARGKLVLAFYTEDNTPLCASEITMLRDDYDTVRELGAEVVGVSADSPASHRDFAERLGGVAFLLASDERLEMARVFGVLDETGKRSRRAVFVVGEDGRVAHAEPWYQPGNAAQYEAIFRALGFAG